MGAVHSQLSTHKYASFFLKPFYKNDFDCKCVNSRNSNSNNSKKSFFHSSWGKSNLKCCQLLLNWKSNANDDDNDGGSSGLKKRDTNNIQLQICEIENLAVFFYWCTLLWAPLLLASTTKTIDKEKEKMLKRRQLSLLRVAQFSTRFCS